MENEVTNTAISSLKHAYKSLSHLKRASLTSSSSSSRFHISVASVLGVAALVLYLIRDRNFYSLTRLPLFSHKETRLQKLYLVPGLQNLGNNCFLNVILQALASCSCFQPYLQKVIEECGSSDIGDRGENLQLTVALGSLLKELSALGEGRVVLSPRRVMLAMSEYVQNFSLTNQQDAEEAFLHLLSSLRDEFSDSYPANRGSLADAFSSSNCRILALRKGESLNEQERWQQSFLGTFDGILCSILACQSCSSQISMNFQFFHSLPLLPVLQGVTTIRAGYALEDCLKQFVVAEQLENYKCSRCWHVAAMKFLFLKGAEETEIEKLRRCSMQDSCTCHNLSHLESLPPSGNFSHAIKQLSIARCPKILCIHLQRASLNQFGELVKLQGHVCFPLILDMLPFTLEKVQSQKSSPRVNHLNARLQPDTRVLNLNHARSVYSKVFAVDESQCDEHVETLVEDSFLPQTESCSDTTHRDVNLEANEKVSVPPIVPSRPLLYRLVSVVEHLGKTGGGHYTVYRSARSESFEECPIENPNHSFLRWYCISDSHVYTVSEEEVLAAEASLLFYERII